MILNIEVRIQGRRTLHPHRIPRFQDLSPVAVENWDLGIHYHDYSSGTATRWDPRGEGPNERPSRSAPVADA